jgi:hypothetical protein
MGATIWATVLRPEWKGLCHRAIGGVNVAKGAKKQDIFWGKMLPAPKKMSKKAKRHPVSNEMAPQS